MTSTTVKKVRFPISRSLIDIAVLCNGREVVVTIILDNGQKKKRAKRIDRFCRVIFPGVFLLASIAIFMPPRS